MQSDALSLSKEHSSSSLPVSSLVVVVGKLFVTVFFVLVEHDDQRHGGCLVPLILLGRRNPRPFFIGNPPASSSNKSKLDVGDRETMVVADVE
jgi:hypothetical protein